MTASLITTRFVAIRDLGEPDGFVPVRISLGLPKFLASARTWPMARELAPFGLLGIESRTEFESAYRQRLDAVGFEVVRSKLGAIWRVRRLPLALACFEHTETSWCHRSMFATWWHERGGDPIPDANTATDLRRLLGRTQPAHNPSMDSGQLLPANPNVGTPPVEGIR